MFFWMMVLLLPALFFFWSVFARRRWKWYWKLLLALGIVFLALKDFFFLSYDSPFYPHAAPPRWLGIVLGVMLATVDLALVPLLGKELYGMAARRFHWKFSELKVTVGILAAVFLVALFGVWNGLRSPRVHEFSVECPALPPQLEGMRILFVTDLHAGTLHNRAFVEQVVRKAAACRPDLILLGGDIVDKRTRLGTSVIEPLAELKSPLGTYAIAGNHEYFGGLSLWRAFYAKHAITLLENTHRRLAWRGADFYIAGVGDKTGLEQEPKELPDNQPAALKGIPKEAFTIELYHRPLRVEEAAFLGVDLRLSGHTHGGIVPLLSWYIGFVHGGYVSGRYRVGEMEFYISPGAGIWSGIPLRLCGTPEIALITLMRQKAAPSQRP